MNLQSLSQIGDPLPPLGKKIVPTKPTQPEPEWLPLPHNPDVLKNTQTGEMKTRDMSSPKPAKPQPQKKHGYLYWQYTTYANEPYRVSENGLIEFWKPLAKRWIPSSLQVALTMQGGFTRRSLASLTPEQLA